MVKPWVPRTGRAAQLGFRWRGPHGFGLVELFGQLGQGARSMHPGTFKPSGASSQRYAVPFW